MSEDLSFENIKNTIEQEFILSQEETQILVYSVMQDYQEWKSSRNTLEKTWQECWQAYLCDVKSFYTQADEQALDRSRIARPVLYETVEAIHSFLMNTILPGDEQFFSIVASNETDLEKANVIESFIRLKLQQFGFYEKFGLFLKQAIITGNSAAAIPWHRKLRKCRINKPVTIFGLPVGKQKIETETVVYEGPDFEVIDMFDFLIDPNEPDFEKANIIRKTERPLHELQQNTDIYHNLEGLIPQTIPEDSRKISKREAFGIDSESLEQSSVRKHNITLYEAWGNFYIGNKVFENYVCTIANGNRLIRFEPNPYDSGLKPFIFTSLIPIPNEIYGIGAIEKSLGLQHAINTLTNQKLDVINISINNPFTYLINDDVFDPDTIVTRPGALIPVKSHDTIKPVQYLNNFTVAFNEIADLKEEINQATGAFKFLSGDPVFDFNRTATEVSALVSSGRQKFSSLTKHLENIALEPTLQIIFEHAKQFLGFSEIFSQGRDSCEMEFIKILPELLQANSCKFKIIGSEATLLKTQELASLFEFIKLLQSDPLMRDKINVAELYKKIYRRLGFRDENLLFSDKSSFPIEQLLEGE